MARNDLDFLVNAAALWAIGVKALFAFAFLMGA